MELCGVQTTQADVSWCTVKFTSTKKNGAVASSSIGYGFPLPWVSYTRDGFAACAPCASKAIEAGVVAWYTRVFYALRADTCNI